MVYTCTNCNKRFKGSGRKFSNKFCDRDCMLEYRQKQRMRKCKYCSKEFENPAGRNKKYCSQWCKEEDKKKEKKCRWCGIIIQSKRYNAIYCNEKCKNKYIKYYLCYLKCNWCGKKLDTKEINIYSHSEKRYCSPECFKEYQKTKTIKLNCSYCGKNISRKVGQINNTYNRNPRKNFFCNYECYYKFLIDRKENKEERKCSSCGGVVSAKATLCRLCFKPKKQISVSCYICNKEFFLTQSEFNRRNKGKICCSKECSNIRRSKEQVGLTSKSVIGTKDGIEFVFHSATDAAKHIGKSLSTITTRCNSGIQGTDGWSFKRKEE